MIRAAILAAVTASVAFAAPVVAQVAGSLPARTVPSLKAAATVNSDLVRIGDLVDNAGAVASIPVFRSPDIGTTGIVPVSQVLDALRSHDLLLVDTRNLAEIEVTRSGHAILSKDIEARIARVFAGRQGLGEEKNLSVILDREIRPLRLDETAFAELAISRAYYDRRGGRFDVTFEIPNTRIVYRFTGALVELAEVGVLARPVGRGETIRSADITIERRPKAEVSSDGVDSLDQAIGFAARQALPAGRLLKRGDLVKPDLVKRDEQVTLLFEAPGITLTMRGKALESGTQGDLVNVLNVQSKRTIQGYVSGPSRIFVPSSTAAFSPERSVAAANVLPRAE
jgi:flagellar basal body P-ring formation protein FlgA